MPGADGITIGGTRASAADPGGHPSGLALDYMVMSDAALGDAIAQYHIAHWDELGVEHHLGAADAVLAGRLVEGDGGPRQRHGQPLRPCARELPGMTAGDRGGLSAVLFDMDGTLVETEQYWGQAMFELAERLGGRMSEGARAATVGSTMRRSMTILHADLNLVRTEEQLLADARWVEDRTAQLLGTGVSPGAQARGSWSPPSGRPTCGRPWCRRHAPAAGRPRPGVPPGRSGGDPFDVTVCGDEVPARKPDPAPVPAGDGRARRRAVRVRGRGGLGVGRGRGSGGRRGRPRGADRADWCPPRVSPSGAAWWASTSPG